MADGNKTDQIPDELENLSPEELQERIQEEKKTRSVASDLHLQHCLQLSQSVLPGLWQITVLP